MPIRVLHIVDASATEDSLSQLSLLLNQLPRDRFEQYLLTIGRPLPALKPPAHTAVSHVPGGKLMRELHSVGFLRLSQWRSFDLVLTWDSLQRIPAGCEDSPLSWVAILSNPDRISDAVRWHETAKEQARRSHFVCLSDSIRQRLMRSGVPGEMTRVIRIPVDLAALRQAGRQRIRSELGLEPGAKVLLTACPPAKEAGQYTAVWATAILYQIWRDVRMILPGGFREDPRARCLSEECYCPEVFRLTGDEYQPVDLLAASDMLVWPAGSDMPVGWLASAMAVGVPIVATRTPSVMELISNGQTGFVADSPRPHAVATRIRLAWEDVEKRRHCVQEASHRAYELFRPQACLDGYLALFGRLLAGASLGASEASKPASQSALLSRPVVIE